MVDSSRSQTDPVTTPPATAPASGMPLEKLARHLPWLPVPLLFASIAVLSFMDIRARFEPLDLLPVLNIIFLTIVYWIVAYLAARTYLVGGTPAVLFLGCGMWVLGIAYAASALFEFHGRDAYAVTIHNCGSLLSGLLIVVSALLSTSRTAEKPAEGPAWWWLPVSYLSSLGAMITVTIGAAGDFIPPFFIPGRGATSLRQVVVLAALVQFAVSAILFARVYRRSGSRFLRWYSTGLELITVGLLGVLPETQLGSPIDCAARLAQYLGGVYILYAVFTVFRQYHTWGIPVGRALHEIELRYQSLVDLCPDAILVHSEGRYIYANPAAARLFGADSPQQVTGRNVLELVAPDYRDLARGRIEQAYAGTVAPLRETKFLRFDGQVIDVESTGAMVQFGGRPAIQIVVRNITERKRSEEALRYSEERYRSLVEMSPDAIFVNRENRIVFLNTAALRLFNASSPRQVLDKSPYELFHPGYHTVLRDCIGQVLAGQPVPLIEGRIVRPDGGIRDVEVAATLFNDQEGPAIQVILRDITDRKEAQAVMARYQLISQYARDPLLLVAADGKILEGNQAAVDLYGYTHEELLGLRIQDLRPRDDPAAIRLQMQKAGSGGVLFETEHVRKDGTSVPVEVSSRGVVVEGQEMLLSVVRDITVRKQAEEALRKAKDELDVRVQERTAQLSKSIEQLDAEVTQRTLAEQTLRERSKQLRLLASELTLAEQRERQRLALVLHDGLQQILVGAKFRLALMERTEDKDVRKAAVELGDLVDDAIETSRSLTAELSPPILREGGLVPALEWLARWMHDRHGLSLDLTVHGQVEPAAEDVTVLLFQATRELLFNVVKHARVKTARVRVERTDDQVQVTVADAGAGFDPTQLRVAGGKAGGFGLFSVRERLNLLWGRMEIDSAPGRGSRISLVAPIAAFTDRAGAVPADQELKVSIGLTPSRKTWEVMNENKIRIMLVDDHIVMRQGLARLLQEEPDMTIVGEASDGESAVRLVREVLPDVILMDISMPGMNGIQATQIIHEKLPDVRIIGLSMFEESERAAAIRSAGAVDYVTKSGPSDAVLSAIRACMPLRESTADGTVSKGESNRPRKKTRVRADSQPSGS